MQLVRSRLSLSRNPVLDSVLDIPILVPVQESREDAVQVCASADEEEDDEQERLELEDAELGGCVVSLWRSRIFGRGRVVPL